MLHLRTASVLRPLAACLSAKWGVACVGAVLIAMLAGGLAEEAKAQPMVAYAPAVQADTALTLTRGTQFELLASPRFRNEDLGKAFRLDLQGLQGRRVVEGAVQTRPDSTARTWLRKQTDGFRLNVEGTANGMVNRRVPIGDRRAAALTVYKIDEVARLNVPSSLPSGTRDEAELLLSAIHYGWSFNVVIVGTTTTFTDAVVDMLRRRIEAGEPIEPLLRKHSLSPVVSSRGLGFGVRTPTPRQIPVRWDDVEQAYDLGTPAPVLAEYVLLRDVQPAPIEWAAGSTLED